MKPLPVILDTDIGTDIDDTWALLMALHCPELDLKLISTATGDTEYRSKIVARMLEACGRPDIPIAVGLRQEWPDSHRTQVERAEGYDLKKYPGAVHHNGIEALIRTVREAAGPVTLLAIAPLTNIAAALSQAPDIAGKCRFVGMHGALRKGYDGAAVPVPEYNVYKDIAAARKTFSAPWNSVAITPLDTCGIVRLEGKRYQRLLDRPSPGIKALMEDFRIWSRRGWGRYDLASQSTILFDTVAVYMAYAREFLEFERMNISIPDDGKTVPDASGAMVDVATDWKDLDGFLDHLTERLVGATE